MHRRVPLLLVSAALLGCSETQPVCPNGTYPGYFCPCPAGQQGCKVGPGVAYCSNLREDHDCGLCGLDCGLGTCSGGACVCDPRPAVELCPVPVTNGNNFEMGYRGILAAVCVDTSSDPRACGGCLRDCGAGSCVAGSCTCPPGSTACAGYPACVYGTCTCSAGEALCGDYPPTSVCTDVSTPSTCFSCPPGQVRCPTGACGDPLQPPPPACYSCPAGQITCWWSPRHASSGGAYCIDLAVDPWNCGACGAACPAGRSCVAGVCG
jgi:hypothetical protein